MKPVRLLTARQAERVRKAYLQYGEREQVTVGRRATCRCCGQPIKKGETALRFPADFSGCGSWTVILCFMHVTECASANTSGSGAVNV